MKKPTGSEAAVILSGYNAIALLTLFRGFDPASILPLIPLFTLLGITFETVLFPFVLCCSLMTLFSTSLMPWALLVSGLLASVAGKDIKTGITGFAVVAVTIWLLPVYYSAPLTVVAAVGAASGKSHLKYLLIPAGFFVSACLTGLPVPVNPQPATAASTIHDGLIEYTIPEINSSNPEVVLPAPVSGRWAVWIILEAGGVRDSIPMLSLRLGEDMLLLPACEDTLSFTMSPGDTLSISLMRDFKPFNHPVIHAAAGGELL